MGTRLGELDLEEAAGNWKHFECFCSNIADAAWRLKDDFELPEDWQYEVYGWLSDNDSGEVENRDDQGGYPSEESLQAAFIALGFPQVETAC